MDNNANEPQLPPLDEIAQEECLELKTLKYKTMLQNGVPMVDNYQGNNIQQLDSYLENEKQKTNNAMENWSKLSKSVKLKKLSDYAISYGQANNYSDVEIQNLTAFFKSCVDKKRLMTVKEVTYDKENGVIKAINSLHVINTPNQSNRYTLKNTEKHVSTLKSLAPKKAVSVRKKSQEDESEDET